MTMGEPIRIESFEVVGYASGSERVYHDSHDERRLPPVADRSKSPLSCAAFQRIKPARR
jgi:hypothetical protein